MVAVFWQHFVFLQLQFIFVNKVIKIKVSQQTCITAQLERPQPCHKLDKKNNGSKNTLYVPSQAEAHNRFLLGSLDLDYRLGTDGSPAWLEFGLGQI